MNDVYLAIGGALALGVLETYVFPYRKCRACDGGKKWSPAATGTAARHVTVPENESGCLPRYSAGSDPPGTGWFNARASIRSGRNSNANDVRYGNSPVCTVTTFDSR